MEKQNEIQIDTTYYGDLIGHGGLVTCIVTGVSADTENEIVVSGSRDKKLIIWRINGQEEQSTPGKTFGEPYLALSGHNHFVSDLCLSKEGSFLLSSSWDKSLRLWSLKDGQCKVKFFGDKKEVMTCCLSNDARQVFSCGFENNLKLWNNKGDLKAVSQIQNHKDCVTRIRYSPSAKNNYYASVGWDNRLKIWSQFFKIKVSIRAHDHPINALAINTNGIYLTTGCKGGEVKVWKLQNMQEAYRVYKTNSSCNDLAFNPDYQWVAAACDKQACVWDITSDNEEPFVVFECQGDETYKLTSIAWNHTGKFLYLGCSDGKIRVYKIEERDDKE